MEKNIFSWLLAVLCVIMVSCGSDDEVTESKNVVMYDGIEKPVLRLINIPYSVAEGTETVYMSANLELEDGSIFGVFMDEKLKGKNIDFHNDEGYYYFRYKDNTSNYRWNANDYGIEPGSFFLYTENNGIYEINFRIEDKYHNHTLTGHYKGAMVWN